jgi:hypothetical protein
VDPALLLRLLDHGTEILDFVRAFILYSFGLFGLLRMVEHTSLPESLKYRLKENWRYTRSYILRWKSDMYSDFPGVVDFVLENMRRFISPSSVVPS